MDKSYTKRKQAAVQRCTSVYSKLPTRYIRVNIEGCSFAGRRRILRRQEPRDGHAFTTELVAQESSNHGVIGEAVHFVYAGHHVAQGVVATLRVCTLVQFNIQFKIVEF